MYFIDYLFNFEKNNCLIFIGVAKLAWLEDRAARGNALEHLDQFAAGLVLDGAEQPARKQSSEET